MDEPKEDNQEPKENIQDILKQLKNQPANTDADAQPDAPAADAQQSNDEHEPLDKLKDVLSHADADAQKTGTGEQSEPQPNAVSEADAETSGRSIEEVPAVDTPSNPAPAPDESIANSEAIAKLDALIKDHREKKAASS